MSHKQEVHAHRSSDGRWVECYHRCRSTLQDSSFWIGVTLSFPIEHFIWEHLWPFNLITHWMGL